MPSHSPRANITVLSLVAVLLAGAAFSSAAIAADRDRDRMSDRWERKYELNPRSAKDAGRDPDRDGLRNRREARAKTNPRRKDTDRDGLRDRFELRRSHTNPRRRDTDRDGMKDGFEVRHGLDPRNPADAAQDPDRRADLTPGTPPSGPGGGLDTVRPASPVGPTGLLTIRLSTDSTGQQANSASGANSVSADGRYVVFTSRATNLVPGDTDPSGVFIKDAHTGTVTRVNKNAYGEPSNQPAFDPVMSADGRYVAFRSNADNLIAGDTPNSTDIFVKDVLTGTITRVSEAADGGVPIGYGPFSPSISVDGRYVSFQAGGDIFVRDTHAGTLTRVSTGSHQSALSADGRYVAFESAADNLVPGDTNGRRDVFVKDTHTGSTTRVSVSSTGTQATHSPSTLKAMTPDGRYVVLVAKDALVPGDTNGVADVFVSDTHTGTSHASPPPRAGPRPAAIRGTTTSHRTTTTPRRPASRLTGATWRSPRTRPIWCRATPTPRWTCSSKTSTPAARHEQTWASAAPRQTARGSTSGIPTGLCSAATAATSCSARWPSTWCPATPTAHRTCSASPDPDVSGKRPDFTTV
jgi:Tol biopolymer transport system component